MSCGYIIYSYYKEDFIRDFFFLFWPPHSIWSSQSKVTPAPLTHSAGVGIEPGFWCYRDTADPIVSQHRSSKSDLFLFNNIKEKYFGEDRIFIITMRFYPISVYTLNFLFSFYYGWFTIFCQFLQYSKVTQLHLYLYILFLILSSIMVCRKWLDIVPCAIQQDLIAYSFWT